MSPCSTKRANKLILNNYFDEVICGGIQDILYQAHHLPDIHENPWKLKDYLLTSNLCSCNACNVKLCLHETRPILKRSYIILKSFWHAVGFYSSTVASFAPAPLLPFFSPEYVGCQLESRGCYFLFLHLNLLNQFFFKNIIKVSFSILFYVASISCRRPKDTGERYEEEQPGIIQLLSRKTYGFSKILETM